MDQKGEQTANREGGVDQKDVHRRRTLREGWIRKMYTDGLQGSVDQKDVHRWLQLRGGGGRKRKKDIECITGGAAG